MIEVQSPLGPKIWVSTERSTEAGRLADKAARLFGYAWPKLSLADDRDRILLRDELVADGRRYALVVGRAGRPA